MPQRALLIVLFLVLLIPLTGFAQDAEGVAVITSPVDGQPLFGLVEITGTVQHPSLFGGYVLEWSNAQNPQVWLPIQQPVSQQVSNGILGQWDTVGGAIPDGIYQIRLRMFLNDGTFRDYEVKGLTLANSAPTNIPTVGFVEAATPTLPLLSDEGTPLIQQPPTVTPRPTFDQPALPVNNSDEGTFVNFGAAQNAFCNGVFFSVLLFGVVIGYLVLRSQISPLTRRIWWQIRSELDDRD